MKRPKERPEKGRTGPVQHAGARSEPRCDGKGDRALRRLVESSNDCNDSNEDEGAEAHRAVHRLVRRYME